MKPSIRDQKKMAAILSDLESIIRKGLKISEKNGFTSHNRIFLHILSHVQTLQESLATENTKVQTKGKTG
jgi:hypothetical protein